MFCWNDNNRKLGLELECKTKLFCIQYSFDSILHVLGNVYRVLYIHVTLYNVHSWWLLLFMVYQQINKPEMINFINNCTDASIHIQFRKMKYFCVFNIFHLPSRISFIRTNDYSIRQFACIYYLNIFIWNNSATSR